MSDLKDGKMLSFTEIDLKHEGIKVHGRNLLEWSSFSQAGIHQGTVVVISKLLTEPYCQVPLFRVPNVHLLLSLVEQLRTAKQPMDGPL